MVEQSLIEMAQTMQTTQLDRKYEKAQIEQQTVIISQISPTIQVSLAQMLPSFGNVQGQANKPVYFQLRSFQVPNSFHNILASDRIILWLRAEYYDMRLERTLFQPFLVAGGFEFAMVSSDRQMNAEEFFEQLNEKVQIFARSQWLDIAAREQLALADGTTSLPSFGAVLTMDETLACVLSTVSFGYEPAKAKLKMALTNALLSAPTRLHSGIDGLNSQNVREYFAGMTLNTWRTGVQLLRVHARLIPSPSIQVKRQKALAQMLGSAGYSGDTGEDFPSVDLPALTQYTAETKFYYTDLDAVQDVDQIPQLLNDVSYRTYVDNFVQALAYSERTCNFNRYQRIYVHTSLQSGYWEKDGRRQDLLELITLQDGIGMIPREIVYDTRIYQNRESPDMCRSFRIVLTDEDGEPIYFQDPFVLRLAFFFKDDIYE